MSGFNKRIIKTERKMWKKRTGGTPKAPSPEFFRKRNYSNIMMVAGKPDKDASMEECMGLIQWWDYMIDTILDDICSEKRFLPFISHPNMPLYAPFPYEYYDEKGKRHDDVRSDETFDVDLASDIKVYSCPWDNRKCREAFIKIRKNGFVYDGGNHKADFYSDIGLCHVHNGIHSVNAGRHLREGSVKSHVFHMELLYPHCFSDGEYWYNSHTLKEEYPVGDFRFAAVYSLAQRRHELRKKMNEG